MYRDSGSTCNHSFFTFRLHVSIKYLVSSFKYFINNEYPVNLLSSKDEVGTVDTTKGVVINICVADEPSSVAASKGNINLPYQSPTQFERTAKENSKYKALNHQIALEMFYLAEKTKNILSGLPNGSVY